MIDQPQWSVYVNQNEVREFAERLYRILKNRSIHSQPLESRDRRLLVCRRSEMQNLNPAFVGTYFQSADLEFVCFPANVHKAGLGLSASVHEKLLTTARTDAKIFTDATTSKPDR